MKLHKCSYLDNEALPLLTLVKDSLLDLQLSSCGDISDSGVKSLAGLSNLRRLLIYDLPEVRDKEDCIRVLQEALPQCDVDFPYAKASELKDLKKDC